MSDKTGREALRAALQAGYDELLAAPYSPDRPLDEQMPARLSALDDMLAAIQSLATPSPDPAPSLDLGSQIAMSGGLPKELKARIDAIQGRASVEPTPPLERERADEAHARVVAEIERLREAVETEWYNGNVDEGARDRILGASS